MTSLDFHRVPLRWSPFFFEDFLAEKLRKSMCVVANLGGGLGGWGEVIGAPIIVIGINLPPADFGK